MIDGTTVRRNVQRAADYCAARKIRLRPHTKTHKSEQIANLQLESGAAGIAVAKVAEAEMMASVCSDLLLAYPLVDTRRAERFAALAHRCELRATADSLQAIEVTASAARRKSVTVGLLVELDVGLGRTGVQSSRAALDLARTIDSTPGVRLDGVLIYPGHVWAPPDRQAPALGAVAAIVNETLDLWGNE
ncbi:MAG: alanine racemase, partial [Pirellulales bacterium]|nr:alanine racemase [Pirellulales bacterium]